jgi:hypothetical protein
MTAYEDDTTVMQRIRASGRVGGSKKIFKDTTTRSASTALFRWKNSHDVTVWTRVALPDGSIMITYDNNRI